MAQHKIKFVNLNEIPTKVSFYFPKVYKEWFQDVDYVEIKKFPNFPRLILMISGNPGEIEYYHQYLSQIHTQTQLPVIGISNSGHNRIPRQLYKPDSIHDSNLFGLDAQIRHKAKFIEDYLHPNTRLILLAHSIGCYVILELLDRFENINQMIDHCILIFPTIDSLIATDSGRRTDIMIRYFYYPLIILSYFLEYTLPQSIKEQLIRAFCNWNGLHNIPTHVIRSASNLIDPYCLQATMTMVRDEFRIIRRPNIEIIKKNCSKLSLFYGESDHWSPVEYYYWIREKLEDYIMEDQNQNKQSKTSKLDLRLCLKNIDHAFVMDTRSCDQIVQLTMEVIKKKWDL